MGMEGQRLGCLSDEWMYFDRGNFENSVHG